MLEYLNDPVVSGCILNDWTGTVLRLYPDYIDNEKESGMEKAQRVYEHDKDSTVICLETFEDGEAIHVGVRLTVEQARELAHALTKMCDFIEGVD